jgi:hypothetical protein
MASTLTLQNTMTWASTLLKNQQFIVSNMEPALTIANIILQRILGPPFRWRFNRGNLTIAVSTLGGTDYSMSLPFFGRVEENWITDVSGNIYELGGAVSLPKVSAQSRPLKIAPQYDDNNGNITFRLQYVPDQSYTVSIDYQQKPQLMTSPGSPWGVVPDEFSYIFNLGFLMWAGSLVNDPRIPIWEQYFVAALLGAQDGLDEQAVNIFLGQFLNDAKTIARSQAAVQGGSAGRQK